MFISLNLFKGTSNSIKNLYKSFFLKESYDFSKYVNSWCNALFYFLKNYTNAKNMFSSWLGRTKFTWWSTIIYSALEYVWMCKPKGKFKFLRFNTEKTTKLRVKFLCSCNVKYYYQPGYIRILWSGKELFSIFMCTVKYL